MAAFHEGLDLVSQLILTICYIVCCQETSL